MEICQWISRWWHQVSLYHCSLLHTCALLQGSGHLCIGDASKAALATSISHGRDSYWGFFFKKKRLLWTTVVKRSDDFAIATFTWRHIVSMASPTTDIADESVMCQDQQIHMRLILFIFFRLVSGWISTNPAIWLVPGVGRIFSYGLLQWAESIKLIYFQEWIRLVFEVVRVCLAVCCLAL